MELVVASRFIPLHLKTGPVPLIKSAFTMHNETGTSLAQMSTYAALADSRIVNIHSHFVPTIVILLFIPVSHDSLSAALNLFSSISNDANKTDAART